MTVSDKTGKKQTGKKCTRCNIEKPLIEFYYHKSTNKSVNWCKGCWSKYHKENKNRNNERSKQNYQKNKKKIIEQEKQRYQENREEILRKAKIRNQRPEVRERNIKSSKKWNDKSKNSYPEKEEDKRYCIECGTGELSDSQIREDGIYCSQKCMGLAKCNPESQQRKGYRGPDWRYKRKRIRERDNYTCQVCGKKENGKRDHDVHHIKSWFSFKDKSKANDNFNLITLCRAPCHLKYENDKDYVKIFKEIVAKNEISFFSKSIIGKIDIGE